MSVEKNVPQIRLKGFSEDWADRSLGSLCLIGDIDHRMPETKTAGIPYLMTGDFLGVNGLNFERAKLISVADYEQLSRKIKPEVGDILFARYASVGAVRYVETEIKFLVSYSCAILKTSNTSYGKFLFYFLQTNRTQCQIELDINTGSQRNIGIDSLKNLKVTLPKSEEQIKIGNTFQKLDSLINQHQKKHDKLSSIKKAMLEKIFPKQGETTPEIRFKGFSGEWESKVLGSVASFYKGKDLPKSSIKYDGVYPCIHYGELFTKYSEVIQIITSRTNQNDNFFSISNDVLMPTSDVTPKGLVKSCCVKQNGVVLGGDILVIRPNDQNVIDGAFLSRFIRTREQQVLQKVTGSTVFHLYASSIENLDIVFPSIEEQKAIGNYFQQLDALINQHHQQITKLNNIKQACLSKMFV